MFLKKAECFSTNSRFKNYSLEDSEICAGKAGWPTYKLQLDITELTKSCRQLLEYEDFKCQEIAKFQTSKSGIMGYFSGNEGTEPKIAQNLEEVNSCLVKMVSKY